jgi:hypothetical protein
MIKANAFTFYRYKTAGNVKLAPPCAGIDRRGEGSGVAETFGILRWNGPWNKNINLGREKAARQEDHEGKIMI